VHRQKPFGPLGRTVFICRGPSQNRKSSDEAASNLFLLGYSAYFLTKE